MRRGLSKTGAAVWMGLVGMCGTFVVGATTQSLISGIVYAQSSETDDGAQVIRHPIPASTITLLMNVDYTYEFNFANGNFIYKIHSSAPNIVDPVAGGIKAVGYGDAEVRITAMPRIDGFFWLADWQLTPADPIVYHFHVRTGAYPFDYQYHLQPEHD